MTDSEIQTYKVTPLDMNPQYRLTQNAALSMMEDGFARYLSRYDAAAFDMIEQDLLWIITEINIRFIPEKVPYWTDHLESEIWLSELTNVRTYTDFRQRNHQGELFAFGNCQWNLINQCTRRIANCHDVLQQMPLREEWVLGPHKRTPFPEGDTPVREREHGINATELDQNMHLNNRAYIDIAMAAMAGDELQGCATDFMHVQFRKEAFLGERLTSRVTRSSEDPLAYHCSVCKDNGEEACHVYCHWTKVAETSPKTYYDTFRAEDRKPI